MKISKVKVVLTGLIFCFVLTVSWVNAAENNVEDELVLMQILPDVFIPYPCPEKISDIKSYDDLMVSFEEYPDFVVGGCLYTKGQYQKAMMHFNQFIKSKPNEPQAYNLAGLTQLRLDNTDRAISYFNKANRLDPTNPNFLINKAEAYYWSQQFTQAKKIYAKAKDIFVTQNNKNGIRDMFIKMGECAQLTDNPAEAAVHFNQAKTLDPENPKILMSIGGSYYQSNMFDKAKQQYTQAAELYHSLQDLTKESLAKLKIAECEQKLDNHTEAIALLEQLKDSYPNLAQVIKAEADSYFAMQDYETAKIKYSKVMELYEPITPETSKQRINIRIGECEKKMGNCQAAESRFNIVKMHLPDNAHVYVLQGECYFELKEYEKAKQEFITAKRLYESQGKQKYSRHIEALNENIIKMDQWKEYEKGNNP